MVLGVNDDDDACVITHDVLKLRRLRKQLQPMKRKNDTDGGCHKRRCLTTLQSKNFTCFIPDIETPVMNFNLFPKVSNERLHDFLNSCGCDHCIKRLLGKKFMSPTVAPKRCACC